MYITYNPVDSQHVITYHHSTLKQSHLGHIPPFPTFDCPLSGAPKAMGPRLRLQPPVPHLHEEILGALPGLRRQGADGRAQSHDVGIAALWTLEEGKGGEQVP